VTTTENVRDDPNWQVQSGRVLAADPIVSPSSGSLSLASQTFAIGQSGHWQNFDSVADVEAQWKPGQPTKVVATDDDGSLSRWIEALSVVQSSRRPPECTPKSVACFYVVNSTQTESSKPVYHHAIYLMQRTLKEFNNRIALKWGLDPSKVLRTLHVLQSGLEILVD
jgi:hypothetical protein